tara:strand:+ start:551 stop:871 length:321 start_codon:yes stop_codon:yes gene_type:complete
MERILLSERLTYKYASGWSELDIWEEVGSVQLKPAKSILGRVIDQKYILINDKKLPGDLSQAIADTMGGSPCQHEHDCCGCPTTYVYIERTGEWRYTVQLNITLNY